MKKMVALMLTLGGLLFAMDATMLPKGLSSSGNPTGLKVLKSGVARINLSVKMPSSQESTAQIRVEATWKSPKYARNVNTKNVTFDNRWHYLSRVSSANANILLYAYTSRDKRALWRWSYGICKVSIYAYPFVSNKPADALVNLLSQSQGGSVSDILIRPYESPRRGYKIYESPSVVCK